MAEAPLLSLLPLQSRHVLTFLDENGDMRNHSKFVVAAAHLTDDGCYASQFDLEDYGFRHRYPLSREFGISIELAVSFTTRKETRHSILTRVSLPPDEVRRLIELVQEKASPLVATYTTFNLLARRGQHRGTSVSLTLVPRKGEVFVESVETAMPQGDVEYIRKLIQSWAAE